MLTVLLVTTAIIVGTFAVGLAGIWKKHTSRRITRNAFAESSDFAAPFLFDRPTRWMAVKCSNLQKVQNALGLHNATPCPLSEGFSRLGDQKLFISPPLKGW